MVTEVMKCAVVRSFRSRERFADGTRLDADSVRHAFDEQIRWAAPHPPGTHFNIDRRTRTEVVDDRTVRLHLAGNQRSHAGQATRHSPHE